MTDDRQSAIIRWRLARAEAADRLADYLQAQARLCDAERDLDIELGQSAADDDTDPRGMPSDAMSWQRASRVWADALGIDTAIFSPLYHEEHFRSIVRQSRGSEAELRRVLGHYVTDEWVRANRPAPKHLAANWHRYLEPPTNGGARKPISLDALRAQRKDKK